MYLLPAHRQPSPLSTTPPRSGAFAMGDKRCVIMTQSPQLTFAYSCCGSGPGHVSTVTISHGAVPHPEHPLCSPGHHSLPIDFSNHWTFLVLPFPDCHIVGMIPNWFLLIYQSCFINVKYLICI
jgi:hypothetical protein